MYKVIDDNLLVSLGDLKTPLFFHEQNISTCTRFFVEKFKKQPLVPIVKQRSTYTCRNQTALPGILVLSENSTNTDNLDALTLHKNMGIAYDFFRKVLKVDIPFVMSGSVDFGQDFANAFVDNKHLACGSGNKFIKPLGRSLELVVHGFAQELINQNVPLIRYGESGAIRNAMADILGISALHWDQFDKVKTVNWEFGASISTDFFPGIGIRSFKNEPAHMYDIQPKLRGMALNTWIDDHTNSGIINHLFYKICMATNSPSFMLPIFLFWITYLSLGRFSGFEDFKEALIVNSKIMNLPDHHVKVLDVIRELGF